MVARLHQDGGPAVWTAGADGLRAELGQAFYEIGRDAETNVVILTGTGDEFLTRVDFSGGAAMHTGTGVRAKLQ